MNLGKPAGAGVLDYQDNTKLFLIAGLAITFGVQNSTAQQFGIQELSTTVLTTTIVRIGFDSRLAGGTGEREKLRYSVVLTMCAGAVVGATMMLTGKWNKPGVHNIEELDPDPFLEELATNPRG